MDSKREKFRIMLPRPGSSFEEVPGFRFRLVALATVYLILIEPSEYILDSIGAEISMKNLHTKSRLIS